MSKWCTTEIEVICENTRSLANLFDLIKECTSQSDYRGFGNFHGYGEKDFENIIAFSHLFGNRFENMDKSLYQGHVNYVHDEKEKNTLVISVSHPLNSIMSFLAEIFDHYLLDYKMFYTTRNFESKIFITNNPKYVNEYIIDVIDKESFRKNRVLRDICFSEEEIPEKQLIQLLQKILKPEPTSFYNDIDRLIQKLNLSDFSNIITLHKFQYVSLDDILKRRIIDVYYIYTFVKEKATKCLPEHTTVLKGRFPYADFESAKREADLMRASENSHGDNTTREIVVVREELNVVY